MCASYENKFDPLLACPSLSFMVPFHCQGTTESEWSPSCACRRISPAASLAQSASHTCAGLARSSMSSSWMGRSGRKETGVAETCRRTILSNTCTKPSMLVYTCFTNEAHLLLLLVAMALSSSTKRPRNSPRQSDSSGGKRWNKSPRRYQNTSLICPAASNSSRIARRVSDQSCLPIHDDSS